VCLVHTCFGLRSIACFAAGLALAACEEGLSPADAPTPPPEAMPHAPQPIASAALVAGPVADLGDAGAVANVGHHAVMVTTCAIDKNGCLLAQPSAPPPESSYRVVFGGGVGAIRTRGQAMADLYKEIRDRTESGGHLAAETHHLGDPPPDFEGAKAAPRSKAAADDPLVEAAFQLMDAVDHDGEVTLDALSQRSASSCKLSIGVPDPDGGAARCLVEAPAPGSNPLGGLGRH
jgi:hypothetical protein